MSIYFSTFFSLTTHSITLHLHCNINKGYTNIEVFIEFFFNIESLGNLHLLEVSSKKLSRALYGKFFFIVQDCSVFIGSIFWSNVVLVWTFNTRGVYNFITKKANIPVNLVLFFNGISFLLYHFLKSGGTNELKSLFLLKSKKVRVIYSKQEKTLLLLKH